MSHEPPRTQPDPIVLFVCPHCRRHYDHQDDLMRHYELRGMMHRLDPEIDEHDGEPWIEVELVEGARLYGMNDRFTVERISAEPDPKNRLYWYDKNEQPTCIAGLLKLLNCYERGRVVPPDHIRELSAAQILGIGEELNRELCLFTHIESRRLWWSDFPVQFGAEMVVMQAYLTIFAAVHAARLAAMQSTGARNDGR